MAKTGAQSALEVIKAGWQRGDSESHSALDYVLAEVEAGERLPRLLSAAEQELERAKRAYVASDVTLADAAARILGQKLNVDAEATAINPTGLAYVAGAEPRLIVWQKGAYKRNANGMLSGELELIYVRGRRHRSLDGEQVLTALEDADRWRFEEYSTSEHTASEPIDGGEADRQEVGPIVAWPPVVIVATGQSVDVKSFASSIASSIGGEVAASMQETRPHAPTVGVQLVNGESGSGNVGALARTANGGGKATLVSDSEGSDGLRRVVVRAELYCTPGRGRQHEVSTYIRKLISGSEAQIGRAYAGLGRVEAVVIGATRPTDTGGGAIEATFTLVSKAG
ncbi:hypothetical protein SAMN05892883_2051 [Jatrophihabitans sp. GAS493]|nr:hypothetical protein SAMN05892883_2051 [Jatrophihabitans sp. GAS493]